MPQQTQAMNREAAVMPFINEPYMNVAYERKLHWIWPAEGRVVSQFSSTDKGIDIAGREGSSVYAAAAGKVVYAGNGLRGYGNLVLIRHDSLYLSAYAHNRKLLVHEGQVVYKGQKIAEMGHTGTGTTILHFEVRRASQPIDPLLVLNGANNGLS